MSKIHTTYDGSQPFDFNGLAIRELTPSELQSASVAEIEVAPSMGHQRARSLKCDKVYFCLVGTVVFRIGDEDFNLGAKDLVLVKKNEWFEYRNNGEILARLLLIHVPPFDKESEDFSPPL